MRITSPSSSATDAVVTYCTNSHAGESLPQIEAALCDVFGTVQQTLGSKSHGHLGENDGEPFALGLWLSDATVEPLATNRRELEALRATLKRLNLVVPSLNAFPFGNFHADEVKFRVYEPGWWDPRRADYTLRCATVLAELAAEMPEHWPSVPKSISTVGLGNRETTTEAHLADAREQLGRVAGELARIHEETGIEIVLALEPEPLTYLETTPESIRFFAELFEDPVAVDAAGDHSYLPRYVGVCFDACHQAVLWEDVAEAYRAYCEAGVRIGKVQVSCAVEREHTVDPHAALARFAEPRFLHQVYARETDPDGALFGESDLPDALAKSEWMREFDWRCHFHVPIYLDELGGGLRSTQSSLKSLLAEVHRRARGETSHDCESERAPLLEIETYTWSVLPPELLPREDPRPGAPAGLIREVQWLQQTWETLGVAT